MATEIFQLEEENLMSYCGPERRQGERRKGERRSSEINYFFLLSGIACRRSGLDRRKGERRKNPWPPSLEEYQG